MLKDINVYMHIPGFFNMVDKMTKFVIHVHVYQKSRGNLQDKIFI